MSVTKILKKFISLITNSNRTPTEKLRTLKELILIKFEHFKRLRIVIKPKPPRFSGWGMTSNHFTPWDQNSSDEIGLEFSEVNSRLLAGLNAENVVYGGGYEIDGYENLLKERLWRHYIIYWTSKFAVKNTHAEKVNVVEAGVWYGMSTTYAISALQNTVGQSSNFEVFLYDAWEGMKEENLTHSEKYRTGEYSYLSLEQSKSNLRDFQNNCRFIKGHIPDVFVENPGPTELSWLHIDLRSSLPTLKTLEHFAPKLLPGGVILFDDYSHSIYKVIKIAVDEYCRQLKGLLFPLPTGQAIFFKH